MPDNPYKVGDKVWWVNSDFQPVPATVKKATEIGCLISADGERLTQCIRHQKLFRDEKVAWDEAKIQLTTQILEKRKQLDALFELLDALRKRLHQMPED